MGKSQHLVNENARSIPSKTRQSVAQCTKKKSLIFYTTGISPNKTRHIKSTFSRYALGYTLEQEH